MKGFFARPVVGKAIVFLVVTAICGAVASLVLWSKPTDGKIVGDANARTSRPLVSVRTIEPRAWPAVVTALGEAAPRWRAAVKAQVDGRIVFISEGLEAGAVVKRGEVLVRLEKSAFEMRAAEAESRLAAAKIQLLREDQEAREALKNWRQSGIAGEPESPLVLRQPQLAAARADVEAARAALAHARETLAHTDIRAPFDGVVVRRGVHPGESLFAGDEAAVLHGVDVVEVGVHLDAAQWALLPEAFREADARLIDPQRQAAWKARVVRESRHLNRESRLRTLFLQVKRPLRQNPPLLPGTFVRAEITGREIPDLLRIPGSALTREGIVWFLDDGDRLRPRRSEPVFHGEGVVYIRSPEEMGRSPRVAVSPNASFTGGLAVQPMEKKREP